MKRQSYNIRLPLTEPHTLAQDEAFFYICEDGRETSLRLHDYSELYKRPGLYEQIFYERLKTSSPKKVAEILSKVLLDNRMELSELRVLDLGAGNGMFGEQMQRLGVARMIGADISREAYLACERDRPGTYDAYYVADFSELAEGTEKELRAWQFDCLSCVAALGFGDIPTKAFINAYNLLTTSGWVAFNIKETFLLEADTSGFSRLVKMLLLSDALEIHHLERYRHRISIDGRPLFYYALIGKKEFDISSAIAADFE